CCRRHRGGKPINTAVRERENPTRNGKSARRRRGPRLLPAYRSVRPGRRELTSVTRGASLAPGSPVATNDSASGRASLPGSVPRASQRIMSERTGRMRVQAETAEHARRGARGFGAVETWVFDLDNTLYPH